jgi:protein involved in polysaccharide export with SLBB domain
MRCRHLAAACLLLLAPALRAQTPPPQPVAVHINVVGEVKNPGEYAWVSGMTVAQAIAAAGGETPRASNVLIKARHGDMMTKRVNVPLTSALDSEDTVEITKRPYDADGPRVRVIGEVNKPGVYTLASPRNPIASAIAAAGGFTANAGDDVQVLMPAPFNGAVEHLSRRSIEAGSSSAIPGLNGDDATIRVEAKTAPAAASGRIIVRGEVATPIDFAFSGIVTLKQALERAGEPLATAAPNIILMRRVSPSDRSRELLQYADIADGALDLVLRDEDIVEVQKSRFFSIKEDTYFASRSWSPGLTLQQVLDAFNKNETPFRTAPRVSVTADHVTIRRKVDGHFQPNDEVIIVR